MSFEFVFRGQGSTSENIFISEECFEDEDTGITEKVPQSCHTSIRLRIQSRMKARSQMKRHAFVSCPRSILRQCQLASVKELQAPELVVEEAREDCKKEAPSLPQTCVIPGCGVQLFGCGSRLPNSAAV